MIWLALAALTVQVGSGSPSDDGRERATPIHVGEQVTGTLPIELESGRNAARKTFELTLAEATTFTAQLESFEFDPRIIIEDLATRASAKDEHSGPLESAWLVFEGRASDRLLITVEAPDARGGEFMLSLQAGRLDPPRTRETMLRATLNACIRGAARAETRGEIAAALGLLGKASTCAAYLNDLPEANRIARRQLQLAVDKQLSLEVAKAEALVGSIELQQRRWTDAESTLERAHSDAKQLKSSSPEASVSKDVTRLFCFICQNLGELHSSLGNLDRALAAQLEWVEIAATSGDSNAEQLAAQALGSTYDSLGDVQHARESVERSLSLAEQIGDHAVIADALLALGGHLHAHGQFAGCVEQCERGLSLSCAAATRAGLLGTLAGSLIVLGRYERASVVMDEQETLCLEKGITDFAVSMQINRALISFLLGELRKARERLENLLSSDSCTPTTMQRIGILVDLGLVLAAAGEDDESLARYEDALELCESTNDRVQKMSVLLDLAKLNSDKRRDYESALAALEQVSAIASDAGDETAASNALASKAYISLLMGAHAGARELAWTAAARYAELGLVEKQIDTEETLALIGLKQGDLDAVDEALCTASALLERHSEERLDSFASAGLRSRFANWGGIAQESAAGHVHACEAVHSDCSAALTEGWRRTGDWKARELFDRLRARSDDTQRADDATRTGTTQSHETIQASMPRVSVRTALVEYVDGLDTLYAYVVLSDAIRLVELGPRAPIELRARRFVEEIASTDATPVAILEDGGWLYQQLIEPVRKFLPLEVAALTVIPTAALAIVPFDALVKPAPHLAGRTISFDDLPFLIDDYCVTYAPSSPVLAELEQRASNERPPRFLILADPGYDAEMQTGSIEKHPHRTLYSYGRLERTRDEAFEIARLLLVGNTSTTDTGHRRLNEIQSERSPSMSTSSFDMYLGEQATPEVLRTDLRGYTNLHFALHGEVDPADPRRSGLLLSRSDASDGLLTLEEILNLRLDADLVVLSACDTARGPIVRGEGVESIAWGFLHAGARAVLATHWAVRDSDAVVIMRKMYDFHFQRRLPYAEALREAKLEYRRSREPRGKSPRGTQGSIASTAADPYFWSAFLLVGTAPH